MRKKSILIISLVFILILTGVWFYLLKFQPTVKESSEQPEIQGQPQNLLPPPECVDKKETDSNLPESCKVWFNIQKTKQQPTQSQNQQPLQPSQQSNEITVKTTGSKYKIVQTKPAGWFTTGQNADIMLSGIDFNNAGGPLLFNHQGNIASDGQRLILADRNNNRILIWNTLPAGNIAPDLVLGQNDFYSNDPGTALDKMNWPIGVALGGGKLLVADTYNDRILIWNSFPTKNGQAADMELKEDVGWPWAVWTDSSRVVVTATGKSKISIWNSFPASDKKADISISIPGKLGTPRSIGSDGKHLVIGDHNAFRNKQGTFFWKTFPTNDNQEYDFYLDLANSVLWGPMLTSDGKLIGVANQLYVWNSFPENENDMADLSIGSAHPGAQGYDFGGSQSGDGSGVAVAGSKLYVSLSNGNKVVGFNSLPVSPTQQPDFAIGADNLSENKLKTNYFITNPEPLTDGKSLFVVSNFDSTLSVWEKLPDESGAKPDYIYSLAEPPRTSSVIDDYLIVAGDRETLVWDLPITGQMPRTINKIGDIELKRVDGLTKDVKYFYLAQENKIYVWDGNPLKNYSVLKFTLKVEQSTKLSSDGNYLVRPGNSGFPIFYKVSEFPNLNAQEIPGRRFNLPGDSLLYEGRLFVADTVFNRIQIWNSVENAIAGKEPDAVLGQSNLADTKPAIGRNRLFWPSRLAFDGNFLWAGEYKFSGRVVRFSVRPTG